MRHVGDSQESYGIVDSPVVVRWSLQGDVAGMIEDEGSTKQFRYPVRDAISMEVLCDVTKEHHGKPFSDVTNVALCCSAFLSTT